MKCAALLLAALALAGCDPTDEQVAKVRQELPPGCTVLDLGRYGDISHLVVVRCDGRRTSTQSFDQRAGKVSYFYAVAQIDQ